MIFVRFHVLYVGQGSANFVEIYDKDVPDGTDPDDLTIDPAIDIPVTTMLFDAGSSSASQESIGSLDYVVARLRRMKPPVMSALVVSHKDADHINLLTELFEAFAAPGEMMTEEKPEVLTVEGIWCGNHRTNYPKVTVDGEADPIPLTDFLERYLEPDPNWRVADEAIFFDPSATNFLGPTQPPAAFWPPAQTRDSLANVRQAVSLSLVVANADAPSGSATKKTGKGTKKTVTKTDPNAGSLVVALILRRDDGLPPLSFIASGDATTWTLYVATGAVQQLHRSYSTYHMTAPHHASFRTTLATYGTRPHPTAVAVRGKVPKKPRQPAPHIVNPTAAILVTAFVDEVQPQTISASAAHDNTFTHPSLAVLNMLSGYVRGHFHDGGLQADRHFISAYVEFDLLQDENRPVTWPKQTAAAPYPHYHTLQTEAAIFTTEYILKDAAATASQDYLYGAPGGTVRRDVLKPKRRRPARVDWIFEAGQSRDSKRIGRRRHGELEPDAMQGVESTQGLVARAMMPHEPAPPRVHTTRTRGATDHTRIVMIG